MEKGARGGQDGWTGALQVPLKEKPTKPAGVSEKKFQAWRRQRPLVVVVVVVPDALKGEKSYFQIKQQQKKDPQAQIRQKGTNAQSAAVSQSGSEKKERQKIRRRRRTLQCLTVVVV